MSASSPDPLVKHRLGGWLPADRSLIRTWLHHKVAAIRAIDPPSPLVHKSVIALQDFIAATPDVRILFNLMLEQVPFNQDPTGGYEVQSVDELLHVFDTLLGEGSEWLYTTQGQQGPHWLPSECCPRTSPVAPINRLLVRRLNIKLSLRAGLADGHSSRNWAVSPTRCQPIPQGRNQ